MQKPKDAENRIQSVDPRHLLGHMSEVDSRGVEEAEQISWSSSEAKQLHLHFGEYAVAVPESIIKVDDYTIRGPPFEAEQDTQKHSSHCFGRSWGIRTLRRPGRGATDEESLLLSLERGSEELSSAIDIAEVTAQQQDPASAAPELPGVLALCR